MSLGLFFSWARRQALTYVEWPASTTALLGRSRPGDARPNSSVPVSFAVAALRAD